MLKQKATRAVGWSAIDQIVRQGLFFATSIIMARLVAPEAYGTVALLYLFVGLAGVFVDVGLSSSLIQRKEISRTDESTVFWFNVTVGLVLATGLFVSAPWISRFYGIEVLIPIVRIYAFLFFLGAGNAIHNTMFARRLDFKTPLKVSSVSITVSAIVGISLAWNGFGVWALVAQTMIAGMVEAVLLWVLSPWRPAMTFSSTSFRSLFRFGGYLFLASLLETVYQHSFTLIIGKKYGVHDLGIYNRANATKQLPTGVLSGILSRVAFPIFAQVADDRERLVRGFRLSIRGIMFINIPMMLGIAVVAEPLILTLFGPVWAPAIPLLQILTLSGILFPLHVLNLSVLTAMGHSGKFLKIEVIKKAVGISLVIAGAAFGVIGMAWAVVISSLFAFVFNAHFNGKLLNYGALSQTRDCLPAFACGITMALLVAGFSHMLSASPVVRLMGLSVSGMGVFVFLAKLFRIRAFTEAINLLRAQLLKRDERPALP